ncbi:MAG TPA: hypothetical protein VNE62_06330 [Actinomycetota bacterium]|nr:hypothetical protein [Actinomycetota bacterium]
MPVRSASTPGSVRCSRSGTGGFEFAGGCGSDREFRSQRGEAARQRGLQSRRARTRTRN